MHCQQRRPSSAKLGSPVCTDRLQPAHLITAPGTFELRQHAQTPNLDGAGVVCHFAVSDDPRISTTRASRTLTFFTTGGAGGGDAGRFSDVPFVGFFCVGGSSGFGGPLMSPYFRHPIPHVSHITGEERFFGPFHHTVDSLVLQDPQVSGVFDVSTWPFTTDPSSSGSLLERTETVRRNLICGGSAIGSVASRIFLFVSPSRSLCRSTISIFCCVTSWVLKTYFFQ